MPDRFENSRILITAGASGIGKAIALAFSAEGGLVHIVDIDVSNLDDFNNQESRVSHFETSVADVSDEAAVKSVFAHQQSIFDGIDVLINCAGIKGPTGAVENLQLSDWQRCLEVNLQATFLCSKYAIPMMKKQSSGSITNLSSTAGWHGYPLRSPYAAAKWAVIGFTKSLAMELGPFGLRANAICPGSVDGERMDRVIADEALEKNMSEQAVRDSYTRGVSMRSFIQADDIAQTALFLSSRSARKITGQYISVDGHLENLGGLDQ